MDDVTGLLQQLRLEHDALVALVGRLAPGDLERPSYADEWTIAQVLSHLGSGSEINVSNLRAAVHGTDAIPKDAYPQLWARWDNMAPVDQAAGFEQWHATLVQTFEEIGDESLRALEIPTAMGHLSGPSVAAMRLREATLHAWDVAVAFDGRAVLRSEVAGILADQLPEMMGRLADASAGDALGVQEISIAGLDPDRAFVLSLKDPVTLAPGRAEGTAELRGPTDAFVRLTYGRLDGDGNGMVTATPNGLLDDLRTVFTGL